MPLSRRQLLRSVPIFALLSTVRATARPGPQVIPLWPGPPLGRGEASEAQERIGAHGQISRVANPRLLVHRPAAPNGASVVLMAGGGYREIEAGTESGPAAQWLQSRGVTAFELIYRLPHDGWPASATFADGQRAVRLVRSMAQPFGLDANRVGVIGFSAGAHLAGMTAVGQPANPYAPLDEADSLSARPDFAGLLYPVLTMLPPWNTTFACKELLGANASPEACAAYSVERQVGGGCPPVFLAQAVDDPISQVENSLLTLDALRRAGIGAELHLFQRGGHGWGMGEPGSEVAIWPTLLAKWAGWA